MKSPARLALALVALAVASLPAAATTYVPVPDSELLAHATAVVEARVVAVQSAPPRPGWPATDTMIEVQRVVAGEIGGRNVLVRLPGGTRPDGSGVELDGIPRFGVGERLFLFLRPGEDGTYRVVHLMLGAFRERVVGGRRVLLRNLDDAVAVTVPGGPPVERTAGPRDAEAFARWVGDAADGVVRAADYFLTDEEVQGIERVSGAFRLFEGDRGHNMRWFEFDAGQEVDFHIAPGGQPGFGEAETAAATRAAIGAWNGAKGSNIRYRYAGTTGNTSLNVIRFDNAGDEIDESFSCNTGGVLGVGGPSYIRQTTTGPDGKSYHRIVRAGITLNKNIQCFLDRVPNSLAQLIAHELGHTLGIHHPCGGDGGKSCDVALPLERDALMYPNIHRDNRGARINDDDRAAARALYPGGSVGGGPAPAPPSQLSATAISATEVELSWQDNSDDETQFRIQARVGSGPWLQVAATGADTTTVVVSELAPATLHAFRVQARRGTVGSGFSGEASATTLPAAPAPPGALAAAAVLRDGVTLSWSDESEDETGFAIEVRTPATEGWNEIAVVPPDETGWTITGLPTGVPHSFRIRALGVSASSLPSPVVSATPQAPDAPCGGAPGVLCLQERFRVTTAWRNPHGAGFGSGTGAAFDGDQSGTFWFFSPDNVELIVKVLDGDALNGHFWVFHGALTDVEYWISVLDTATGRSRTYYNPPFDRCGQFDTTGIPADPPPQAGTGSEVFPNPPVTATATASCGDEGTLCLLDGRFEVQVDWVNQHAGDETGFGRAVAGSDETGYFWFFDPANVELVVKMLDARAVNGRFWVFFGSLSDVEYSLTVRDTETLEVRSYGNAAGSQCGQFDTDAFPIATAGLTAP